MISKEGEHMLEAIIHGIILAFGLIIPLGPQNVFVFNQGVVQKRLIKYAPTVITASICDTLLVSLAILGVSVIVFTISWIKLVFFAIGFLFLLYIGWSIWNSNTSNTSKSMAVLTVKQQIVFTMSFSLLNPHAILDTIGVIGTNSLSYSGGERLAFALACIIVSWIWFLSLAISGQVIGKIDTNGKFLAVLNKVSALIIWGIAIYIGWMLLGELGT